MQARWWLGWCVFHAVACMLVWWQGEPLSGWLTWRSSQNVAHWWTWWTSAWVHRSTPHLVGNQLAVGALAAAAWLLRPSARAVWAWCLAWPLVPMLQVYWPLVGYYMGLSGLVHAGVAILAIDLFLSQPRVAVYRRWGVLLGLGLSAKLLWEQGWSWPVVWNEDLGMSVVQSAHWVGALAGGTARLAMEVLFKSRRAE